MITVADEKSRVMLRNASPGDKFEIENSDDGRFILTPLKHPAPGVTFVREGGLLLASTKHKITMEQTRALLDEFP